MERLLNVKDAARFLNVSEMTVRRWTNSGLLSCYRVGRKRERRFRIRELEEYLASTVDAHKTIGVPMGFLGLKVPDGTHLTHLYRDAVDALGVGVPYVKEGLQSGETVLVVAHEAGAPALLGALRGHGMDVEALINLGKLHVSAGMPTPSEQAAHIWRLAAGSPGRFRLLGEMLWAKEKGWTIDQLRNLEEMSNRIMRPAGKLFLCQYSLQGFSGQEAMMAIEQHQYVLYKGRIQKSPYLGQV